MVDLFGGEPPDIINAVITRMRIILRKLIQLSVSRRLALVKTCALSD